MTTRTNLRPVIVGFAAALFALVPTAARGQTIRMDDGKAPPNTLKPNPDTNRPSLVYVAYLDAPLLDRPGGTGATRLREPAKIPFMKGFNVTTSHQSNKDSPEYVLLAEANESGDFKNHVGWINAAYLVRTNKAIADSNTLVVRKAMIITRDEKLKDRPPIEQVTTAPVRYAPDEKAPTGTPFRLFRLFFVYGETNGHVLLGTQPEFFDVVRGSKPDQVVLGWVPSNRICPWNTREAVEWDRYTTYRPNLREPRFPPPPTALPQRLTRGRVFESADDAHNFLAGADLEGFAAETFTDRETLYQGERMPQGVSVPIRPDRMRYPILEWGKTQLASKKVVGGRTLELVRVGVVGSMGSKSQDDVVRAQQRILALKAQQEQTEILFVIDDTGSMSDYFPIVADTVKKIHDEVVADPKRKVRIAVSYYRDTTEKIPPDKATQPGELKDAREHSKEIMDELNNHVATEGGSPLELPFLGIRDAVKKAEFLANSNRLLILLGDFGDRSLHPNPNERVAIPNYPTMDEIAALLAGKEGDTPVEFFPIQVIDPDSRGDDKAEALAFRNQMREISDKQRALVAKRGYTPTSSEPKVIRQRDAVIGAIMRRYDMMAKEIEDFGKVLGDAELGIWDDTRMTATRLKKMKDSGIDIDLLRSKDVQAFQEGYVWRTTPDGLPQLRDRLLVRGADLKKMADWLSELEYRPGQNRTFKRIIEEVIKTQIDERDLSDVSFDDFVKKALGLKVRSPLLQRKLGLFAKDAPADKPNQSQSKQDEKEVERLLLVRDKMLALLGDGSGGTGKRYEYERREMNGGGDYRYYRWVRKGNGTVINPPRAFKLPGDESVDYYWIDMEDEWP